MRIGIVGKEWAYISQGLEFDSYCQYNNLVGRQSYKSYVNTF